MPFRAVHPPRSSKQKTTPTKNRPHSCGRLIHLQKRIVLPLVLILLMRQTQPWTNQNRIDLESKASQVLHQKRIDFSCKNSFQRVVPFRAVHPPRKSKQKTTPIKNRPQSCGRLTLLQKQSCHHGPTKTELAWNQKLHKCFIKKASISIIKMVFKGVFKGVCPSEQFTPQEAVSKKPPQLKIGPTAVAG